MAENFDVTWNTFTSYGKVLFRDLMETGNFSDITLVSDDQHQFQVHKFILSYCSPMFQKILKNNPANATIFLRGISHRDIQSIIQFMYLGKTIIHKGRMKKFLKVAKDLSIKEIGENIGDEYDDKDYEFSDESFNTEDPLNVNEYQKLDSDVPEEPLIKEEKLDDNNSMLQKPVKTSDKMYSCNFCDKKLSTLGGIYLHTKVVHNEIRHPCQQCDYQATQPSSLKAHIQYKHEGSKFPCDQCEHQAPTKGGLQRHVQRKHNNSNGSGTVV